MNHNGCSCENSYAADESEGASSYPMRLSVERAHPSASVTKPSAGCARTVAPDFATPLSLVPRLGGITIPERTERQADSANNHPTSRAAETTS